MNEPDGILFAAFDDDPLPSSATAVPGVRPSGQPRPDPSNTFPMDPIPLLAFDSETTLEAAANHEQNHERLSLAFDIGLFDPKTDSFFVVYAAGTPLVALKPRTISFAGGDAGAPITLLRLYARSPGEAHPVPYLTVPCPRDIRGQWVTLRFKDPANPRSLVICGNGDQTILP